MRHDVDWRALRLAIAIAIFGALAVAGAVFWAAHAAPPTISEVPAPAPPAERPPSPAADQPSGWPVLVPATREERRLLAVAQHHCPLAGPRHFDVSRALQFLRLEADAGVPAHMRGLTLAGWCREAAYGVEDIIGDGGRAEGVMQLHELLASHCGPTYARHSPAWSVRCYLHHVKRVVAKVERVCGRQAKPDVWTVAEAWVAGGRRYSHSCRAMSSHTALLENWHRRMARMVAHEKQHALSCEERGL